MKTYYVSAYATYVRDYKVQAESKEEAIELVQEGDVDHYDEDFIEFEVEKDGVQTEEEENSWITHKKFSSMIGLANVQLIMFKFKNQ